MMLASIAYLPSTVISLLDATLLVGSVFNGARVCLLAYISISISMYIYLDYIYIYIYI